MSKLAASVCASLLVAGVALTACSSSTDAPSTPRSTTDKLIEVTGEIVVIVDCGEDGVAGVKVTNRGIKLADALVGRNPKTLAAGGRPIFSEHYAGKPGSLEALIWVTTSPTLGACKTTITNYETGNVVVQKESAGKSFLEVAVKPPA